MYYSKRRDPNRVAPLLSHRSAMLDWQLATGYCWASDVTPCFRHVTSGTSRPSEQHRISSLEWGNTFSSKFHRTPPPRSAFVVYQIQTRFFPLGSIFDYRYAYFWFKPWFFPLTLANFDFVYLRPILFTLDFQDSKQIFSLVRFWDLPAFSL